MTPSLPLDRWSPYARTTWRDGSPLPQAVLALHLRVMISRVLRTGRGPEPLVAWVKRQLVDLSSSDGSPADQLTERLLALFNPPTTQTVPG